MERRPAYGDTYRMIQFPHHNYMIARVDEKLFSLVCLEDGNRYTEPSPNIAGVFWNPTTNSSDIGYFVRTSYMQAGREDSIMSRYSVQNLRKAGFLVRQSQAEVVLAGVKIFDQRGLQVLGVTDVAGLPRENAACIHVADGTSSFTPPNYKNFTVWFPE